MGTNDFYRHRLERLDYDRWQEITRNLVGEDRDRSALESRVPEHVSSVTLRGGKDGSAVRLRNHPGFVGIDSGTLNALRHRCHTPRLIRRSQNPACDRSLAVDVLQRIEYVGENEIIDGIRCYLARKIR